MSEKGEYNHEKKVKINMKIETRTYEEIMQAREKADAKIANITAEKGAEKVAEVSNEVSKKEREFTCEYVAKIEEVLAEISRREVSEKNDELAEFLTSKFVLKKKKKKQVAPVSVEEPKGLYTVNICSCGEDCYVKTKSGKTTFVFLRIDGGKLQNVIITNYHVAGLEYQTKWVIEDRLKKNFKVSNMAKHEVELTVKCVNDCHLKHTNGLQFPE